jgi:hypothetical protein
VVAPPLPRSALRLNGVIERQRLRRLDAPIFTGLAIGVLFQRNTFIAHASKLPFQRPFSKIQIVTENGLFLTFCKENGLFSRGVFFAFCRIFLYFWREISPSRAK